MGKIFYNNIGYSGGGGGGGLLPYLFIDSEPGSTVTVTAPDGSIITPTAAGSGHWGCEVPVYGTYIIHSVLVGEGDATISVAVDTVKEYHITDNHFDFTINVTAPNNSTIRITSGTEVYTGTGTGSSQAFAVHQSSATYTVAVTMDGNTKTETITSASTTGQSTSVSIEFGTIIVAVDSDFITAGSSISCTKDTTSCTPQTAAATLTFHVPEIGTWEIAGTISSDTYTVNANVTDLSIPVNINLNTIPNGKTVTPTDNIQLWLNCANIFDKNYTTLGEVLADEETLRKLLTSDNANDYLVRSKTWSVNPGLVPAMLGSTVPSGEVISEVVGYNRNEAYKAFDGDDTTIYLSSATTSNTGYLGYIFDTPTIVRKAVILLGSNIAGANNTTLKLQYEDGGNWLDAGEASTTITDGTGYVKVEILSSESNAHAKWRIQRTVGSDRFKVFEIQFYPFKESIPENELAMKIIGQDDYAANTLLGDSDWREALCGSEYFESVLNTKVPTMTADNAPEGQVIFLREHSSFPAWKAFDNDDTTRSSDSQNTTTGGYYLGYMFEKAADIIFARHHTYTGATLTWKIQYSETGESSDWHDASDIYQNSGATGFSNIPVNGNSARYWRAYGVSTTGTTGWDTYTLQFYGRQASGVQTLLKAAGITNKPYLTIEEVLADHETVQKIMHSHDAVDYLVTAKLFIDAFTSDAFAMRCIGLRNYAADTLLGDSDWREAILDSDYKDFVFNIEVPAMTSATDPEGTVFANSYFGSYYPYKAFTGENDSGWKCVDKSYQIRTGDNIGYTFPSQVKCYSVSARLKRQSSAAQVGGKIQGSNDGFVSDINDVSDEFTLTATANDPWYSFPFTKNIDEYDSYRFICTTPQLSGSNNYGLKLQFYGRTDVDETKIQVYSAANDSFKLLKSDGTFESIDTTDSTGHVEIAKTAIPTGQQTLYSGVAKNPNKLTDYYFKRVNIDDWTSIIELMPDDALYWYGYESPDLEDCTTANGWSVYSSSVSFGNPTHDTNDITIAAASSKITGVGTKLDKQVSVYESVSQGITSDSEGYGWIQTQLNSKILGNGGAVEKQILVTTNTDKKYIARVNSAKYGTFGGGSGKSMRIKSIAMYKKAQTPTFLSAANDVLYILDGARQIPIAITNAEGKSYDPMLAPGTYTIYSSVAKDPNNLSNPYSKTVTITADTLCVPVMPDGALYWWGCKTPNMEEVNSTNGWTSSTWAAGYITPTYNDTYVRLQAGDGGSITNVCAIASKNKVDSSKYTKAKAYMTGSGSTLTARYLDTFVNKDLNLAATNNITHTEINSASVGIYDVDITQDTYTMLSSRNHPGRYMDITAFWVE